MKRVTLMLITALLLAGCAGPSTPDNSSLIATLVAATLNAEPQATTSVPPSPTPAGDLPTVTVPPSSTPITPSPTATLTPTYTLTPSVTPSPTLAPGDPVLSLGNPTWEDNFTSGANWNTYEESASVLEYKDGKLVYTANKSNNSEYWGLSWPSVENFYLEYTGTFGEECSGKDRFGLLFRAPKPSKGFLFGISCDGAFRLYAWDGEEYQVFKDWKKSEHINTGPGATNRVGIRAKGTKLTGYVNGYELVVKNSDLFSEGKFGVFIAAAETPGFQVEITHAAYWKLP